MLTDNKKEKDEKNTILESKNKRKLRIWKKNENLIKQINKEKTKMKIETLVQT